MSLSVSERRITWSKNTNYASVASPRPPMEIGSHAHAPNKSEEQRLETNNQIISQIHRKSLAMMAGQRKLLEKSMLAYSEKMKEINGKRSPDIELNGKRKSDAEEHHKMTSELFREIQSRNGTSSRSLPDIHMSHDKDAEHPSDYSKVDTRRKHNSGDKTNDSVVSHGGLKHETSERTESNVHSKVGHSDFRHLRSLLRRSSSADLISVMTIPRGLRQKPTTRFDSTQSLIDTAEYLDDYRQKVHAQFKPKRHSIMDHQSVKEVKLNHDNHDSAYSSGFDSSDELSEADTRSHSGDTQYDRYASTRKRNSKKMSVSKKGHGISKAKPKVIRKGRKLLKKMNTEGQTENLLKAAIMSSVNKHNGKTIS